MNEAPQIAPLQTAEQTPRRVLFVCTGNTCRSPMAAALLNEMARPRNICSQGEGVTVSPALTATSAGVSAAEGEPITPFAAEALRAAHVAPREGNDYLAHRARNVTEAMLAETDEVVAVTARHAMALTFRFPAYATKIETLPIEIPDPYGGTQEDYNACLSRLALALELRYGVAK